MAWKILQFRLTGDAPLIVHNGQLADPLNRYSKMLKAISGRRKKTDSDLEEMAKIEFLGGLYMGKDGPILPADVIDACVIDGAKKTREGVLAKSGFFTVGNVPIEYDGPRDALELWNAGNNRFSRPVVIGRVRVIRTRPIFPEWALNVTAQYEESVVNAARVVEWFNTAGALCGLCEWRPKYGRFQVVSL